MATKENLLDLANDLEAKRWRLMLNGDAQALAGMISDDLQYVHSSGVKDGKQQYLDAIRTGTVIYRSADSRIETVTPLGVSAFVASGVVTMEATIRGAERRLHSIFMVVWGREQDVWQLVAHQTTLLPA